MTELQRRWFQRAVLAVHSYRQMHSLACEILHNAESNPLRRSAKVAVERLSPLIDLPVADAAALSFALRAFLELVLRLEEEDKKDAARAGV